MSARHSSSSIPPARPNDAIPWRGERRQRGQETHTTLLCTVSLRYRDPRTGLVSSHGSGSEGRTSCKAQMMGNPFRLAYTKFGIAWVSSPSWRAYTTYPGGGVQSALPSSLIICLQLPIPGVRFIGASLLDPPQKQADTVSARQSWLALATPWLRSKTMGCFVVACLARVAMTCFGYTVCWEIRPCTNVVGLWAETHWLADCVSPGSSTRSHSMSLGVEARDRLDPWVQAAFYV
ncbi:hypothetical protein VTK56DRAFT_7815 [Thermocarpiscus australiensis]